MTPEQLRDWKGMALPWPDGPPGRDSFDDFYRHGYSRLCNELFAYLGDSAEAEDVVQEAEAGESHG